ncbi:hypothetical protein ACQR1I_36625, partial [Bradyrhizobium sp. HKCCYLS2038]|uniref:hypothetical protein n=1 Tax=unclassified Bradyrhizobium TaxID=2631580 RepID=UPI003EBB3DCB
LRRFAGQGAGLGRATRSRKAAKRGALAGVQKDIEVIEKRASSFDRIEPIPAAITRQRRGILVRFREHKRLRGYRSNFR